jgi:hypothetical protein
MMPQMGYPQMGYPMQGYPMMPQMGYQQPLVIQQPSGGGTGSGINWNALAGGFMTAASLLQNANLNSLQQTANEKETAYEAAETALEAATAAYTQSSAPTQQQLNAVFQAQIAVNQAQKALNQANADVATENARSSIYNAVGGVADIANAFEGAQTAPAPQPMVVGGGGFGMPGMPMGMAGMPGQPMVMVVPNQQQGGMSPGLTGALAGGATAFLVNAVFPQSMLNSSSTKSGT